MGVRRFYWLQTPLYPIALGTVCWEQVDWSITTFETLFLQKSSIFNLPKHYHSDGKCTSHHCPTHPGTLVAQAKGQELLAAPTRVRDLSRPQSERLLWASVWLGSCIETPQWSPVWGRTMGDLVAWTAVSDLNPFRTRTWDRLWDAKLRPMGSL